MKQYFNELFINKYMLFRVALFCVYKKSIILDMCCLLFNKNYLKIIFFR